MKEATLGKHAKIAMVYFIIAAILGVVLRSFPLVKIPANYKFMVHTHSHIALLGWVYVALTVMLYHCFAQNDSSGKRYRLIFWCTQGTLVGMLLSFPFQGYALFSIIFSTLFLFCSYFFFGFFIKNIKPELKNSNALKCIKAALWYMVLSSLGPWALGPIMNTWSAESIWYRLAIYFYLHFQYNGWMVMALVGLFVFLLEQRGAVIGQHKFNSIFWTMNLGIVLSFLLSTLWTDPSPSFYVMGGLGALAQLAAFAWLLRTVLKSTPAATFSKVQSILLRTVVVLLFIKMIMQLLTSLPYFAKLAHTYLDFTIGYLHLTFLGVVSMGLFLFLDIFGLLSISKKAYNFYLMGFLITELLIFYKGTVGWLGFPIFDGHACILALGSLLIPIGLIILLWQNSSASTFKPNIDRQ